MKEMRMKKKNNDRKCIQFFRPLDEIKTVYINPSG